jgi:hypothetical protein
VREGIKVVSFESNDSGLFQSSQLCFKSSVYSALTDAQPGFCIASLLKIHIFWALVQYDWAGSSRCCGGL